MTRDTAEFSQQKALDARVDAKIASASPALLPVLSYLRNLVHEAVPAATETIKWGMPFFEYKGTILANLGIFQKHCSFGFWSRSMTQHLQNDGIAPSEGAGSLGKIRALEDLPPRQQLVNYLMLAAKHIDSGNAATPATGTAGKRGPDGRASSKPEVPMPEEFARALQASPAATQTFEALPASCRREYLVWIAGAKRDETRRKRTAQAIAQLEEGKRHNWQYEAKHKAA